MEWIKRDPFLSVKYAKDDNVSRRYYFSDMDIKEIITKLRNFKISHNKKVLNEYKIVILLNKCKMVILLNKCKIVIFSNIK